MMKFYVSESFLLPLGIQLQEGSPTFEQSKWVGIIVIKLKELIKIHFVLVAVASLDLKTPDQKGTFCYDSPTETFHCKNGFSSCSKIRFQVVIFWISD